MDVATDIARTFPAYHITTVFDVGANVGDTALEYLSCFPDSEIYCFEPVRKTFRELQRNVGARKGVHCVQVALGAQRTVGRMALAGKSARFRLLSQGAAFQHREDFTIEDVDVLPIDEFCADHNVSRINYLKVDTEGADLDVLKGAAALLDTQRVDFVEVEAGMNAGNGLHVPFEVLKSYLESRNYLLFGIYAQMHEWPTKQAHLRRINSTFVSRRMVDGHKVPYRV